jgi:hypothetical protein
VRLLLGSDKGGSGPSREIVYRHVRRVRAPLQLPIVWSDSLQFGRISDFARQVV